MTAGRRFLVLAALAALFLAAPPARAYFDDVRGGARATSLGGGLTAGDDDVTALRWNPALLGRLAGPQLVADHAAPYVVPDLATNALTVGAPWRGWGVAAGWHRLGIAGAYAEDVLSLGAGRRVTLPLKGQVVFAGASYKLLRVGFQPFTVEGTGEAVDYGAQAKGSLDVGLAWESPWRMQFAWTAHDVLQPRFHFVDAQSGGFIPTRQDLGVAWRWNPESTLLASIGHPQGGGRRTINAGMEILFFRAFAIRTGFTNMTAIYEANTSANDLQFTGGFGILHDGVRVDAAAATHHELGISYQASLVVPLKRVAK